jgi:hypothetical protein
LFNQQIEQLSESKNKAGTAGLKIKKSFFGRKLGYSRTLFMLWLPVEIAG